MKEHFIDHNFGASALEMLAKIEAIIERYSEQGYDLSLRQLYYQLVAAAVIENSERSYKNIGNLVSDARLAGLLDWDMIKDRGRELISPVTWRDPAEIIEASASQFQIDMWKNQPKHVEVMVEKQALEGVLLPVCRELRVPFIANKGYSSSSALYEAGDRMSDYLRDEREVHVIYLGDHDPSGIDMTRDVEERLRLFARAGYGDEVGVEVHRIALNMDQVRKFRPPENPAKLTDSRSAGYVAQYGNSSWELDALEPSVLAGLVRANIQQYIDYDIWAKDNRKEEAMKKEMMGFARQYRKKSK